MPKFKIACSWEVCGEFEIEADNMNQALKQAAETKDIIDLPKDREYINGSFQINEGMSKWINGEK